MFRKSIHLYGLLVMSFVREFDFLSTRSSSGQRSVTMTRIKFYPASIKAYKQTIGISVIGGKHITYHIVGKLKLSRNGFVYFFKIIGACFKFLSGYRYWIGASSINTTLNGINTHIH